MQSVQLFLDSIRESVLLTDDARDVPVGDFPENHRQEKVAVIVGVKHPCMSHVVLPENDRVLQFVLGIAPPIDL